MTCQPCGEFIPAGEPISANVNIIIRVIGDLAAAVLKTARCNLCGCAVWVIIRDPYKACPLGKFPALKFREAVQEEGTIKAVAKKAVHATISTATKCCGKGQVK